MADVDERAYARMARTSWLYAAQGARHLAHEAAQWARAEGIEAHIRERDARALSAQQQRAARAHKRRGKRATTAPAVRAHALTDIEVNARAFAGRATRAAVAIAMPAALVIGPPWALIEGNPGALLLWPAAYGYLAWNGWLYAREHAAADVPATPTGEPKAKLFSLPKRQTSLKPNAEEIAILDRVHNWEAYAADRKLHEVIPDHPVIDESGMLIPVTFAGMWTPAKLDSQLDQVRSLLAVPDEVRTQVKPGGTADRAVLRVRTRIRELDLRWTPEREGIGLDADTGEVVYVDTTDRVLVAGMSGSGKSVALRVLMAEALSLPNTVLVIIDLKVEGALWAHVARVESEPDGIAEVIDDLTTEMKEREDIMRANGMDMWEPTTERPRIVVVIDEGAELMAEVPDSVPGARSLARRARSAQMPLWWATQKPTVTGKSPGLDSSIAMQLTSQVCMAVPTPTEARTVLGEDATAKGWHAEDLPKGGWALVKTQGEDSEPNPVRVWFMAKEDVKALTPREAWRRPKKAAEVPEALAVALHLSRGTNGVATATLAAALNIRDTDVHARMREFGVNPEPNAFAIGNGEKARGYRREVLESAMKRWEDQ